MNALGMVILSHIRSLISRPESGAAIVLTMVSIGVLIVSFISSYGPEGRDKGNYKALGIKGNNYRLNLVTGWHPYLCVWRERQVQIAG